MFGLVFLFIIVVINLFEIFLIFTAVLAIESLNIKVESKILRSIIWGFIICISGSLFYHGFVCSSPYVSKPSFLDFCFNSLWFSVIFILSIPLIINYLKNSDEERLVERGFKNEVQQESK